MEATGEDPSRLGAVLVTGGCGYGSPSGIPKNVTNASRMIQIFRIEFSQDLTPRSRMFVRFRRLSKSK
jgi:hypothetical protein